LLVLLCAALLAWRVDFRIEQCHPSTARVPVSASIAFFDANERNIASLDAPCAQPHSVAETRSFAFCAVSRPPLLQRTDRWSPEASPTLPDIPLTSVALLANPPPSVT
jgi:hypothetical protein